MGVKLTSLLPVGSILFIASTHPFPVYLIYGVISYVGVRIYRCTFISIFVCLFVFGNALLGRTYYLECHPARGPPPPLNLYQLHTTFFLFFFLLYPLESASLHCVRRQ